MRPHRSPESQVSQTTHTLPIRVSVPHEVANVPGGLTAIVRVAVDPVTDVLLAPRETVIVTGQGTRVVEDQVTYQITTALRGVTAV